MFRDVLSSRIFQGRAAIRAFLNCLGHGRRLLQIGINPAMQAITGMIPGTGDFGVTISTSAGALFTGFPYRSTIFVASEYTGSVVLAGTMIVCSPAIVLVGTGVCVICSV